MKIISTKMHGVLDYPWGILLIASPWLFGFTTGGAAMYIPIVLGIALLVGSVMTDYEGGLLRVFSMRTHVVLDMLTGLFLAASPWLFGFDEVVYKPHLILGLIQFLLAMLTSTQPGPGKTIVNY